MTINTVKEAISRIQFTATAGQTDFDFNFLIFEDGDLDVFEQIVGGNPIQLTLGVDYTVTGALNVDGGRVILIVGAAAGTIITIDRAVPIDRTTDFITGGKFEAKSINTELDRRTVVEQQNNTLSLTRMLLYDTTDPLKIGDTSLPFLQPLQFWQKNGAGNLTAVTLESNQDVNTLRSELASETFSAPGAGIVGYFDSIVGSTTVNGELNNLHSETQAAPGAAHIGYFNQTTGSTTVNDDLNNLNLHTEKLPLNNLLINGNFRIWQRGTNFVNPGGVYTTDRWIYDEGVGGAATVSRQAFTVGQTDVPGNPEFFVRIDQTTAGTNNNFAQRIRDVRTENGQKITVAFFARANGTFPMEVSLFQNFGAGGSAGVQIAAQTPTVTTAFTQFVLTFDVPSISGKTIGTFPNFLQLNVTIDSIAEGIFTLDLSEAQFVKGTRVVDFEFEDVDETLSKCQSYYETGNFVMLNDNDAVGNFPFGGSAYFKQTKLFIPTVNVANNGSVGLALGPTVVAGTISTDSIAIDGIGVASPTPTTRIIKATWTAESEL